MSTPAPLSDDPFADLLSRLPATLDLDALALETKAIQRRRGLRSGADLLRLGLAWGPGERSLREAAAWSGLLGFAELTDEALIQRLHKGVAFFEAITAHLLRRAGATMSWPGRQLRMCDATCLSGPASQGTDWRIHAVYDLGARRFAHLEVTDGRGGEALDRGAPVAGEIRIADRGYATAQTWHRFRAAGGAGSDFIVRMRWNTVSLVDDAGNAFDLIGWLKGLPDGPTAHDTVHEQPVRVMGARGQACLAIRLVARRKPPDAVAATLKHLHRQASRGQHRLDPRSAVAAAFVLLATSLPADAYPADEVLAAYRLRWQIELAFKRLKSLLHVGRLRTRTEPGTRCWLHTHLIMALLCDDQSQDLLDAFPPRTCLRRDSHPPCGVCTASSIAGCEALFWASFASTPSPKGPRRFIAASPTPGGGEKRPAKAPSHAYLSAYGASPRDPTEGMIPSGPRIESALRRSGRRFGARARVQATPESRSRSRRDRERL